jgi:F0F1-type ATP synthase assembly protein I
MTGRLTTSRDLWGGVSAGWLVVSYLLAGVLLGWLIGIALHRLAGTSRVVTAVCLAAGATLGLYTASLRRRASGRVSPGAARAPQTQEPHL